MNRREQIVEDMKDVFTSSEAAEYLNITPQRLNKLVHDGKIRPVKSTRSTLLFYKGDLNDRSVLNAPSASEQGNHFNINNKFVRDAILYFTIQQLFNNSDKKTERFLEEAERDDHFDFHEKLIHNLPYLAEKLNISEQDLYQKYTYVKNSFLLLDSDTILLSRNDEAYSSLLRKTADAPRYLFAKGNISLLQEKSVCVVGSRNASEEGIESTRKFVKSLVDRNIVVNAGLARGIDTAAHTSALNSNGKTIAVIGTPINRYYPKENQSLQKQISRDGLVISQFPPCNKVERWNFPLRNYVMSGIAEATIIMEAGETSGALIQATDALKQGRLVLIPQKAVEDPKISWPEKYLKKGAHSFGSLQEALDILNRNLSLTDSSDQKTNGEITDVEMD